MSRGGFARLLGERALLLSTPPPLAARLLLAAHALCPSLPSYALSAAALLLEWGEAGKCLALLGCCREELLRQDEARLFQASKNRSLLLLAEANSNPNESATPTARSSPSTAQLLVQAASVAAGRAGSEALETSLPDQLEGILYSIGMEANQDGEREEAIALLLAAHILQPRSHRTAFAASRALMQSGDILAGVQLLGTVDFSQVDPSEQAILRGNRERKELSTRKMEYLTLLNAARKIQASTGGEGGWGRRAVERRAGALRKGGGEQWIGKKEAKQDGDASRGGAWRSSRPARGPPFPSGSFAAPSTQRNARKRFARSLIIKECNGFIEKQLVCAEIKRLQLSVWRVCLVYMTHDELRYQRVRSRHQSLLRLAGAEAAKASDTDMYGNVAYEVRDGTPLRRVPLDQLAEVRLNVEDFVVSIKEKRGGGKKVHRLLLSSADEAQLWATNLLQAPSPHRLISFAGHNCRGYMEGLNEDGAFEVTPPFSSRGLSSVTLASRPAGGAARCGRPQRRALRPRPPP
ncbi:MAG: hypothetical protein SGPRY_003510 [Prymnesium sp.]